MSSAGRTEVVVIGGGVIDCSIAYHLAKNGVRVTLLERWGIAAGVSGASAGGVRHQQRDFREFSLAFRAIEQWRSLESELEADLSYRRHGHLTTIEHEVDLPARTASTQPQIAAGLDIRLVQGAELRALAPSISPSVIEAAYTPNDGHASPGATTRAFAAAAERAGAKTVTGVDVKRIECAAGRVTGVGTDQGSVAAGTIVLAAGAWSKTLAGDLEVEFPLTARGFQAITTKSAPHQLE